LITGLNVLSRLAVTRSNLPKRALQRIAQRASPGQTHIGWMLFENNAHTVDVTTVTLILSML